MFSICFIIHWKIDELETWNTSYGPDQHIRLLTDMAYPPESIFYKCSFQGLDYPCDNKFWSPTVTNKGICYTFNGMDASDIYRDVV